jgi:pyruvate/2-oxoglutarate dehydrogenase complex dihydrolipoamide dehydrogenase (E3) component
MELNGRHVSMAEWNELIDDAMDHEEPLFNLPDGDGETYDAIFVGGGAGGRFGAAYMRAMGGRPLIVDRWPFLGGTCPHQACVPHHLFSEAAALLDRQRQLAGQLWFKPDASEGASILDLVNTFRAGRTTAHSFMNWQSKEQLEIDYVLNAAAEVLSPTEVRAAGRVFTTRNIVLGLGATQRPLAAPGGDLPGVYDFATLIEELDYEPQRPVVIGGGKIAVEYGAFFQAVGRPTTIVSRSDLLGGSGIHHFDEEIRDYVVAGMRSRGVETVENATLERIEGDGRVERVVVTTPDGASLTLETDFVFNATGEKPNSDGPRQWLGLECGVRDQIVVDSRMRTSVEGVYAIGDLIGPPMEMFKARKCGMTAARNIMGEEYEFDFSQYPDFLHTTYEVTWVGLTEREARERCDDVAVIQMPPKELELGEIPLPCAEGTMLYAFLKPELSGLQKCIIDSRSRRVLGFHHVGYGAKDAFQYLDYLLRQPEGLTIDNMAEMNELFLNPEHFIQLCRLRGGQRELVGL